MYTNVTTETAAKIESFCRSFGMMLTDTASGDVISGDIIVDASSAHSSTSSREDIELGAVSSAQWTITLSTTAADYVGHEYDLALYLRDLNHVTTLADLTQYTVGELAHYTVAAVAELGKITSEPIPMGRFTCVKAPRQGDGRVLTLYDKLYFADREYKPNITLPAESHDIERDICVQLGISYSPDDKTAVLASVQDRLLRSSGGHLLSPSEYTFTIRRTQIPTGTTMRQMLGYIAAARGQFGYIDRAGAYSRKWYGASVYTLDASHADEPTLSESENRIVGIVCTVSDSVTLTAGEMSGGRVIEVTNPLMNDTVLSLLMIKLKKLHWYTASVYHRLGDPRLDIGDVATVESQYNGDCDIPITGLDFKYDGGLSADISAAGLTEEEEYYYG